MQNNLLSSLSAFFHNHFEGLAKIGNINVQHTAVHQQIFILVACNSSRSNLLVTAIWRTPKPIHSLKFKIDHHTKNTTNQTKTKNAKGDTKIQAEQ